MCLAALSCNMTQLEPDSVAGSVELSFEASMGDNQDTRTVLQEDRMSIWWTPRDSIKVFSDTYSSGLFVSTNTEPANIAVFSGTLNTFTGTLDNENGVTEFVAVYPYNMARSFYSHGVEILLPDQQVAADNTFARGMFPAAAKSTNLCLSFYNICGGIVFTVQDEGIRYVTLTGNNGESLAGVSHVTFIDNLPSAEVKTGLSSVTLKCPGERTFTHGVR